MELLSVIVPVYNTEKYLKRCVDSILRQTYRNLEVILVDDGSTDRSGAVCDAYAESDRRVRVLHRENGGQSAARNAGIAASAGRLVTFVDSDDWIVPDIYAYAVDLMEKTGCDVADFQCVYATSGAQEFPARKEELQTVEGKQILYDYLYRGQTEIAPFVVFRKIYKRALLEGEKFPEGKIYEDIGFNYRILARCGKLVHTNKIGYCYFQESLSTTRNGFRRKDFDLLDACEDLRKLAADEADSGIRCLAEVKYARTFFSLLAKIAFYGFSDGGIDEKQTVRMLTGRLREYYPLLMRSPVAFGRKLMITAVCIHLNCLRIPLEVYKRLGRGAGENRRRETRN